MLWEENGELGVYPPYLQASGSVRCGREDSHGRKQGSGVLRDGQVSGHRQGDAHRGLNASIPVGGSDPTQ